MRTQTQVPEIEDLQLLQSHDLFWDEQTETPRLRPFTVDEYHHLINIGFFGAEERIELINGYLIMMSPLNPPHAAALTLVSAAFYERLFGQCVIRSQSPITVTGRVSEPEPDLVLAQLQPGAYARQHPSAQDIFLLIEISDSTLRFDWTIKKQDYAAAGIHEYWIMNLVKRVLEVYWEPYITRSGNADYRRKRFYQQTETVAPQAFPNCLIPVDQIFPELD